MEEGLNESITTNMTSTTIPDESWFFHQYGTKPPIYVITIYHLYPVIVIGRVVHIFWYFIGIFGNAISLRIWTLSRMRRLNSSALYLVSINICDLLFHMLHVFYYLKYFWGLPSIDFQGLCETWNVLNFVPQYASQLLVFGFTAERMISIVNPFHGERFSRHKRAPKAIAIIFAIVIILALPQGYFWTLDDRSLCSISLNALNVYEVWSVITESIIFVVVPVTTLILNMCILYRAKSSVRQHKQLRLNGSARNSERGNKEGRLNKAAIQTLLCISFFRILTQLPMSIMYTFQNFNLFPFGSLQPLEDMSHDPGKIIFLRYWGSKMLIDILGASHHALGVFIFYASTKQFKHELIRMFLSGKHIVIYGRPLSPDRSNSNLRLSNNSIRNVVSKANYATSPAL